MKKIIILLLPLALFAGACTEDEIETTDYVDNSVSNTCTDLNRDISILQALVSKEGVKYTALEDGTITFADASSVNVAVSSYTSGYVNPVVGISSDGQWTLEGKAVGVVAKEKLLKLKIEKDVWRAYYGGVWNSMDFSLRSGEGIPVFSALPSEKDGIGVSLPEGSHVGGEYCH